jgi:mono/diheme cytochrome c family protein
MIKFSMFRRILSGLLFITICVLGYLTLPLTEATAQSGSLPAEKPDTSVGLPIYEERCANCHGVQGLGDGELAAGLANPPTAHASPEYLRTAFPSNMFDTVTEGRIDKGMPPFGPASSNPLTDVDRWALVATIYSMGTPIDSVKNGQVLYEENCVVCHGATGAGDGPDADSLDTLPGDLGAVSYWAGVSNQHIFDSLAGNSNIEGHKTDLTEDELWSVVDYVRTFGYTYADVLARYRPLEFALVGGQVINGTTGDVPLDSIARLRAFTQDLEIALDLTETLDEDGRYQFDLSDVPQDLFYRVSLTYDDVEFGSDFGQLSYDEPEIELPITVYDKSSDSSAVDIEQLHIVLSFGDDTVQISELYVASHNSPTVFVGESGVAEQGTFEMLFPDLAENVFFQRGFGSLDSFVEANEIVATDDGWADTLPLRPGPAGLTLLASYELPYDDQATISHPLKYDTAGINLVIQGDGVSLAETEGWTVRGQQTLESGTVSTYGQINIPAGNTLTLNLEGRPRSANVASGLVVDNTTEILIGGAAAVLVIVGSVFAVRRWRLEPEELLSRDELLQEVAVLDDEFEAGEIEEDEYRRERQKLIEELSAVWDEDGQS